MFISQWLYWYLGLSTAEQDLDQKDILGHATLFMFGRNSASPRIIFFHAGLSRTSPHFFPGQATSGSFLGISTVKMSLCNQQCEGRGRRLKRSSPSARNLKIFSKIFIPRVETHRPRHCTNTRQSLRLICSQSKCSVPLWLLNKLTHSRQVLSTWINTGRLCKTNPRSCLKTIQLQEIRNIKGFLFSSLVMLHLPQQCWVRFNHWQGPVYEGIGMEREGKQDHWSVEEKFLRHPTAHTMQQSLPGQHPFDL